jgi:hypothetical protein
MPCFGNERLAVFRFAAGGGRNRAAARDFEPVAQSAKTTKCRKRFVRGVGRQ